MKFGPGRYPWATLQGSLTIPVMQRPVSGGCGRRGADTGLEHRARRKL
jgi:hypothetical protein